MGDQRATRPRRRRAVEPDRGRRRVDGEAPSARSRRAEEATAFLDLDTMLPVPQLSWAKRLSSPLSRHAPGNIAAVERPLRLASAADAEGKFRKRTGADTRPRRRPRRVERGGERAACTCDSRNGESDQSDDSQRDGTTAANRPSRSTRTG